MDQMSSGRPHQPLRPFPYNGIIWQLILAAVLFFLLNCGSSVLFYVMLMGGWNTLAFVIFRPSFPVHWERWLQLSVPFLLFALSVYP